MTEPVRLMTREEIRRNRVRWLRARQGGLGGSDAAAVLGLSPWASPLSVYAEKIRTEVVDRQPSTYQQWGIRAEDMIARGMAKDKGVKLAPSPGLLAHPDRRWQMVTPDRLTVDKRGGTPYGVLEVKNVSGWKRDDWPADEPPVHVVVQVQHGLDVLGYDVGFVAALLGGNNPRWYRVERDDDLIRDMRAAEARFWRNHVTARVPPEPLTYGHDADLDALAELYPGDPEVEIAMTAAMQGLWAARLDTGADKATAEAELKAIDAHLLSLVRDARVVRQSNGTVAFTVVRRKVARFDESTHKTAEPACHAKYTRPEKADAPYLRARKQKETGNHAAA